MAIRDDKTRLSRIQGPATIDDGKIAQLEVDPSKTTILEAQKGFCLPSYRLAILERQEAPAKIILCSNARMSAIAKKRDDRVFAERRSI